jgi:L-threonylcarbamoyladenylate synthase
VTRDALSGLVAEAVERLRGGGLVGYPTETLYGLGADASSNAAVDALYAWKGRAPDEPVSVLVADAGSLPRLGLVSGPAARRLAQLFWPGPLTLVLARDDGGAPALARRVGRADGAVGVRCSSHPVARALASAAAKGGVGPVTATSLNRSGEPAARTRREARALCGDAPGTPWLVDDDTAPEPEGLASTVVDCTEPTVRILREGAIAESALRAALLRANLAAEERPR